jgi:hypothetical protein
MSVFCILTVALGQNDSYLLRANLINKNFLRLQEDIRLYGQLPPNGMKLPEKLHKNDG